MMTLQIIVYIAIAIFITWLIIWFSRRNEEKARLSDFNKKVKESDLSIKKGSTQHQWVTSALLDDERFKDTDASLVLINGKMKLIVDSENWANLYHDTHLLRAMNEALHQANDDFDQQLTNTQTDNLEA